MSKVLQLFKIFFSRQERLSYTLQEFVHQNKNLLIIVADPKTDKILVAYKDKHTYGQIKSVEGKKMTVVRDVLNHSKYKGSIDSFLTTIIETMNLPVKYGKDFLQYVDASLYNIANALSGKVEPKKEQPADVETPAESNNL